MKKLFTIAAIAVISLSFTSCRQDDDTADFNVDAAQTTTVSNRIIKDSVKADAVKAKLKPEVDPDPPVKDGTSW